MKTTTRIFTSFLQALLIFAALATFSAAGARAKDYPSLTPEQRIAVDEALAKVEEKQILDSSKSMRNEVDQWSTLVVDSLAHAATKANMVANDFIRTPTGMLITGVILWKVIGKDVSKIVGGIILGTVGSILSLFLYSNSKPTPVQFEFRPKFWGLFNKRYVTKSSINPDQVWWVFWSVAVCAAFWVAALILALV